MVVTVGKMREIVKDLLDSLSYFDDDDTVLETHSSDWGMGDTVMWIGNECLDYRTLCEDWNADDEDDDDE